MLRKMTKYELRAVLRVMSIVWIGLLAMSLVYGLSMRILENDVFRIRSLNNMTIAFSSVLYSLMFMAMIVVTTVIIVIRFYKGMLGDEAYLTHTLPVKVGQSIMAKTLVALVITVIGIVVGILSITVTGCVSGALSINLREFFEAMAQRPYEVGEAMKMGGMFVLLLISSVLAKIYTAYLSMALGQISNKHKVLMSVVAYVAIGFAITLLSYIVILILYVAEPVRNFIVDSSSEKIFMANGEGNPIFLYICLAIVLGINLVKIVGFHCLTEYLLRRKLNLE